MIVGNFLRTIQNICQAMRSCHSIDLLSKIYCTAKKAEFTVSFLKVGFMEELAFTMQSTKQIELKA